ncbi:MAG: hypothetical protein REI94_10555 [Moraxellaceae bacterium]|nr:hypothetical protein [Moraxellaceae bacterium]
MVRPVRTACLTAALVQLAALPACQATPPTTETELPVILAVNNPAHLQDQAWLQQTATRAGGHLRFRSAISSDTAGFVLACSATDTGCARTLARLRSQPGIRLAEPDQKVSIQ